MIVSLERQQSNTDLLIAFLNPLSQRTKAKSNTSLSQSENEVSLCFEKKLSAAFRRDRKKTPRTRKRQNHNLGKKTAGAIEKKAAKQSLAAEEALLSIATYKEGEMATLIECITSLPQKHSYSQHSL